MLEFISRTSFFDLYERSILLTSSPGNGAPPPSCSPRVPHYSSSLVGAFLGKVISSLGSALQATPLPFLCSTNSCCRPKPSNLVTAFLATLSYATYPEQLDALSFLVAHPQVTSSSVYEGPPPMPADSSLNRSHPFLMFCGQRSPRASPFTASIIQRHFSEWLWYSLPDVPFFFFSRRTPL